MKLRSLLSLLPRAGALLAVALCAAPTLLAQAQFAGRYIGTLNTRITVPILGTTESGFGAYIADVSADGTFNLNSGGLTGTVSASGAVTITGGTSLAVFGIRSATIANNQLSSASRHAAGNPANGAVGASPSVTSIRRNRPCSASVVSSNRNRPASSIATRSASRSTSPMSCDDTTTVHWPAAETSSTPKMNSSRINGSSPLNGSSSTSSFGR
ncbi:MAG: hypothetical protein B9S34_08235 [Opitutia bacterium Tous-C1TDCM]|nr:MAG: hypothetical protein B9S34_08235 [Opitutae bacterium Tous-C1TDCM]